jgi:D-ribose pyranose/furanose isomerase RbsD
MTKTIIEQAYKNLIKSEDDGLEIEQFALAKEVLQLFAEEVEKLDQDLKEISEYMYIKRTAYQELKKREGLT